MKLNLRHKITAANLIVLILTLIVVSFVIIQGLDTLNKRILVQNLIHQADVSVLSVRQSLLSGNNPSVSEKEFNARGKDFASKLSKEAGMRVLVFSKSKALIADSENKSLPVQEFKELDEVLKGNRTYVIRRHNGSRFMYFAFPVMQADSVIGEIVFVYPMERIDATARNVQAILIISFIIGIVVILLVSIILSLKITKPIVQLTESTREIANGKFKEKINIKSSDEIGELAKAFNSMADEIEQRINMLNVERVKLSSILESMGEGVVALDSRDKVIAINSAASSIMNSNLEREIQLITKKVRAQKSRVVLELTLGERSLLVCATPLKLDKAEKGIVLIINDITELRQLQQKQGQFLTNVSHELKTPLTTIMGYVDLLKSKGHDKNVFDTSIHYLKSSSNRLLRLVNDLIDLSCLSKFEFEIEPKSTNLSSLLKEIVGQMSLKAQKFKIKMKTDIPDTSDILVDPIRMKQVVVNALDNAIKYSQGDEIQINLSESDTSILVDIIDNGCGIPAEMLDRVFEPFQRVDKARSRNLGGNGLGLSIAREIVEKHNGSIKIDSKEGEGTRVSIKLPKIQ